MQLLHSCWKLMDTFILIVFSVVCFIALRCFDTIGWTTGRTSSRKKILLHHLQWFYFRGLWVTWPNVESALEKIARINENQKSVSKLALVLLSYSQLGLISQRIFMKYQSRNFLWVGCHSVTWLTISKLWTVKSGWWMPLQAFTATSYFSNCAVLCALLFTAFTVVVRFWWRFPFELLRWYLLSIGCWVG